MGTMERDNRDRQSQWIAEDQPAILRALRRADSECRRVDLTYVIEADEYAGPTLTVRMVSVRLARTWKTRLLGRQPKVVWVHFGGGHVIEVSLERVKKVVVYG